MTKKRDYRAEYARRIARGSAKGLSRTQARGHPKAIEAAVSSKRSSKPISEGRLQIAFKVLRQEKSLTAAARAAKIAPERLRHFGVKNKVLAKERGRWIVPPEVPRSFRLFTNGQDIRVRVNGPEASVIGRFMSAVSEFLRTNNPAGLREFEGVSITDVSGKSHPFETRPNALYRLASAHDQSFEHIYRIVV